MANDIVFNNCYEYSITLCGVTYSLPAYLVEGKGNDYFIMNQPYDPENSECIDALDWGLFLYFVENYPSPGQNVWVLEDGNGVPMAYVPGTDQNTFPTVPYSEWTIIEGTNGNLIEEFSFTQIDCPQQSCDCNILISFEVQAETPYSYIVSGYPFGIFNGKTIYYSDGDPIGTGPIGIYWSYIAQRWFIDSWGSIGVFPELEPIAFRNSIDCPDGLFTNNPEYVDPKPFLDVSVFLNCNPTIDYTYPSIDQYCCINIGFSNGIDVIQYDINIEMLTWLDLGEIPTYTFSIDAQNCAIIYNSINNSWELYDVTDSPIILAFSNPSDLSDICPISSFNDWNITSSGYSLFSKIDLSDPDHPYNSLYIYGCEPVDVILPGDHDAIDCDPFIPCQNNQTLKRSSAVLSKEIASISKREVFGFNCDDAWNTIFMKNSIIHALSCLPYGFYSEADEQCLIGKLNDKCNC